MVETLLNINEIFGPTLQGEGRLTGQRCFFVRTSRCNLHCVFCDTPYTWAFTEAKAKQHGEGKQYSQVYEEHPMTTAQVIEKLKSLGWEPWKEELVIFSGGEPMLQQRDMDELITMLCSYGTKVQFETAGTVVPSRAWANNVVYSVSPKLENSGNNFKARYRQAALKKLRDLGADFKFVVVEESDFQEIEDIIKEIEIPDERVWIMPEGVTYEAVQEHALKIVDHVLKRGWNFSMRVHVAIWGTERAR